VFFIFEVLRLESLQECKLGEAAGDNENGFTVRAFYVLALHVPRDWVWYMYSTLAMFDCNRIGCNYFLVRLIHG
jgi:hypothetical protein